MSPVRGAGGKSGAVTAAITGALGGQTDLQVAANSLAPYAAQKIGGNDALTAGLVAEEVLFEQLASGKVDYKKVLAVGINAGISGALPIQQTNRNSQVQTVSTKQSIVLDNGFYKVDGMKISEIYYSKLWNNGRPAPFVQAREILNSKPKITVDPRGAQGYMRYEGAGMEMIYNPTTGQIRHIQPIRVK